MKIQHLIVFGGIVSLTACNNMNRNGENTTAEGTTTTNAVNSDMEEHRTPAGTDTIASPGSNSMDLKDNANISNQGTGGGTGGQKASPSGPTGAATDPNMKNQDDTHGKSTQAGDNGH